MVKGGEKGRKSNYRLRAATSRTVSKMLGKEGFYQEKDNIKGNLKSLLLICHTTNPEKKFSTQLSFQERQGTEHQILSYNIHRLSTS